VSWGAAEGDDKYRQSRSILDRTGRWAELAELEEMKPFQVEK